MLIRLQRANRRRCLISLCLFALLTTRQEKRPFALGPITHVFVFNKEFGVASFLAAFRKPEK